MYEQYKKEIKPYEGKQEFQSIITGIKKGYLSAIDVMIHQMNVPHIVHGVELFLNGYNAHHEKTAKYLQEQRTKIENE